MSNALSFDGANAYISLSNRVSSAVNNWTIVAWINPTAAQNSAGIFYNGDDNGGYGMFYGAAGDSSGQNLVFLAGGVTWSDIGMYVAPGSMSQVVFVRRDGKLYGYLNGASKNHFVDNTPNTPTAGRASIGCQLDGSGNPQRYFNGKIYQLKFYERALTDREIEADYNYGVGQLGDAAESNLVGLFNFTEGTGTTTSDDSSSGLTGTLSGGTLPSWTTKDNDFAPYWAREIRGRRLSSHSRSDGKAMVPRGVSMSGLEFAPTTLPGVENTDFTENQSGDYSYVGTKGFNTVRLPFLWERLQPTLNGALDATYKGYIDDNLTWAAANSLKVILEAHNYGRYTLSGTSQIIGDGTLTQAHFVDLWDRISSAYSANTTIIGYDLMNEPHDMTVGTTSSTYNSTSTWTLAAQAAINQIRTNDTSKYVLVELDGWAGIQNFQTNYGKNPTPWITDSANKLMYSFHYYMDSDNSGTYSGGTVAQAIASIKGDILPFLRWGLANNITMHCGEFGVPNTGDWNIPVDIFLNALDNYGVWTNHWAMGSWYTSTTTLEPTSSWTVDRLQMDVVGAHLGII